jgi:hypothetical protein
MTQQERKAFYRGRTDAFAGDKPDLTTCETAGEREEYRRGFRQAAAEERLNADTEWD